MKRRDPAENACMQIMKKPSQPTIAGTPRAHPSGYLACKEVDAVPPENKSPKRQSSYNTVHPSSVINRHFVAVIVFIAEDK